MGDGLEEVPGLVFLELAARNPQPTDEPDNQNLTVLRPVLYGINQLGPE